MSKSQLDRLTEIYNHSIGAEYNLTKEERNLIATTESLTGLAKMILKEQEEK